MLAGRPSYFPAAFAAAMPSRWRSGMISRSHVVTPARTVSVSLLVGLRVSSHAQMQRLDEPLTNQCSSDWWRGLVGAGLFAHA
jgi:hypothetical protein